MWSWAQIRKDCAPQSAQSLEESARSRRPWHTPTLQSGATRWGESGHERSALRRLAESAGHGCHPKPTVQGALKPTDRMLSAGGRMGCVVVATRAASFNQENEQ